MDEGYILPDKPDNTLTEGNLSVCASMFCYGSGDLRSRSLGGQELRAERYYEYLE